MSADDLGPGDVVVAVANVISARWGTIPRGTRATVTELSPGPSPGCNGCDGGPGGVHLAEFPNPRWFCLCRWRRVGGSRSDTIRLFAADLTVRAPDVSAPTKPERETV